MVETRMAKSHSPGLRRRSCGGVGGGGGPSLLGLQRRFESPATIRDQGGYRLAKICPLGTGGESDVWDWKPLL